MRYRTPGAFRTSLEQRLLAAAQQSGVPVMRLRKLVVFDRLLARLQTVAPDRWLLKGAVALEFRLGSRARMTNDLDLAGWENEGDATLDLITAQSIDIGDFFTFVIVRTGRMDAAAAGMAVRYHVDIELAGRPFERIILDVGFRDPVVSQPDLVRGPDLLLFAEIAPLSVPTLPLAIHVAEKFHAYSRWYPGQRGSSRVKDLIDIVLICSSAPFDAGHLRSALHSTFAHRGTHQLPRQIPPAPVHWVQPYRTMALEIGLPPEIADGYQLVSTFLNPILSDTIPDTSLWDPNVSTWFPPTTLS